MTAKGAHLTSSRSSIEGRSSWTCVADGPAIQRSMSASQVCGPITTPASVRMTWGVLYRAPEGGAMMQRDQEESSALRTDDQWTTLAGAVARIAAGHSLSRGAALKVLQQAGISGEVPARGVYFGMRLPLGTDDWRGSQIDPEPTSPGFLVGSVIFCLSDARWNEIRSQPPLVALKSPGSSPLSVGTRCRVFTKAHLCCRRLSHLNPSPGHAGAGGARS